jgi:transposase
MFRKLFFQQNQSTMPSNKTTDFSGQTFYIGIDVHKKSWTVTVRTLNLEVKHFTQAPDVQYLVDILRHLFPGGTFLSAYEAGFCGTSIHTALCKAGISNIIIHPADLPQTDKLKKNKTDLHDSRAIARYLQSGLLSGIHVMPPDQQERRALFRCREARVKDVTRCNNRLRGFLNYFGVQVPEAFSQKQHISQNFLSWLKNLELLTAEGTATLHLYLEELIYQRRQLLLITKRLKESVMQHYKESFASLLSIPGIGSITSMAILTETGDLNRFGHPDEFAAYLGLMPSERSSGDHIYHKGLQPRCNSHLRPLLIEAAWVAIRRCPVFLSYFKKHAGIDSKKAIVKVARKLALTAKTVALKKTKYQAGYLDDKQNLQPVAPSGFSLAIQGSE